MNSLSFSASFIIIYKPIEWNLNSVFANKFGKIQCWPRNYDKLQIAPSWFFTILQIFVYIWSNSKILFLGYLDSTCLINNQWVYSVSLEYLVNSVSVSNTDNDGK